MTDRMGEVSAMNRLKKAASLGFGPLMEKKAAQDKNDQDGAPPPRRAVAPPREFRSRSRSGGRGGLSSGSLGEPGNPAAVAVREQQERRREALRQVLKGGSDEPDLDGFLGQAKKPVGPVGPKLDVKVGKLDLKISTSTTMRATAASSGARPKAGAKAAPAKTPDSEALVQRQQEEKVAAEFEEMQRKAQPNRVREEKEDPAAFDYDDYLDDDEKEQKRQKRDQKKQREEWRKKRREELKKQGSKKHGSESESLDESEDEQTALERKEKEDAKMRAQTWRTINNNGRYSKVAGAYVGQLSDRDLDKRVADAAAKAAQSGGALMSEAEVIAKIAKGRTGRKERRSKSPERQRF